MEKGKEKGREKGRNGKGQRQARPAGERKTMSMWKASCADREAVPEKPTPNPRKEQEKEQEKEHEKEQKKKEKKRERGQKTEKEQKEALDDSYLPKD